MTATHYRLHYEFDYITTKILQKFTFLSKLQQNWGSFQFLKVTKLILHIIICKIGRIQAIFIAIQKRFYDSNNIEHWEAK